MQSTKFFDDMAKLTTKSLGTFLDMKKEVDSLVKQNVETILGAANLVSREEFEVVKKAASNAKSEQQKLEKKIADLEKKLASAKVNKGAGSAAAKSADKSLPVVKKESLPMKKEVKLPQVSVEKASSKKVASKKPNLKAVEAKKK